MIYIYDDLMMFFFAAFDWKIMVCCHRHMPCIHNVSRWLQPSFCCFIYSVAVS